MIFIERGFIVSGSQICGPDVNTQPQFTMLVSPKRNLFDFITQNIKSFSFQQSAMFKQYSNGITKG